MRVYMASFYQTIRAQTMSASTIQRITYRNFVYPWMLESFHYMDKIMARDIREHNRNVFLDSGAFSAFTVNAKIDLDDYAHFLRDCGDLYHVASNVDVIGTDCEEKTYANQKYLESKIGTGIVCPVHHVRDHDDWLKRYMDEGYEYLFLGGMVPETTPVLRQWLDHVWMKYLTNPDGTPKLKVHGFGLTTEELMYRYPWFSVDSTSWLIAAGFGFVFMDFPQEKGEPRHFKVNFSEHSSSRYDLSGWHFTTLKADEQEMVRARLEQLEIERRWVADPGLRRDFKDEHGTELRYTPEAIGKSLGLRRVMNMDYFIRMAEQRTNRFARVQETLF
jgi:hypothetical protein